MGMGVIGEQAMGELIIWQTICYWEGGTVCLSQTQKLWIGLELEWKCSSNFPKLAVHLLYLLTCDEGEGLKSRVQTPILGENVNMSRDLVTCVLGYDEVRVEE